MKWQIKLGKKKLVIILPRELPGWQTLEAELEGKTLWFRWDPLQKVLFYQQEKGSLWTICQVRRGAEQTYDYQPSGQIKLFYEHYGVIASLSPEISPYSKVLAASQKQKKSSGATTICSPLTGIVLKVTSSPGQQVSKGETLMIIEAMKMENRIAAPQSGVLDQIEVEEGSSVRAGSSLLQMRFSSL